MLQWRRSTTCCLKPRVVSWVTPSSGSSVCRERRKRRRRLSDVTWWGEATDGRVLGEGKMGEGSCQRASGHLFGKYLRGTVSGRMCLLNGLRAEKNGFTVSRW